jgi:predicted metalloendopeptidase
MDLEGIEKAGLKPLDPLLARIAGVTDVATLSRALAALQASGIGAGFAFAVQADARDSSTNIAYLRQAGLGLPDRDYYFHDDARSKRYRDEYRKHLARIFELAGDAPEAAAHHAATTFAIETELARASMTGAQRRDIDKTYNRMSLAKLAESAPGFPWADHLEALGARGVGELVVNQPAFLAAFAKLAGERPPAQWRAYLRWHLLKDTASKLPRAYREADFAFSESLLKGVKAELPRDRTVIEIIAGRNGSAPLGHALGMLYVATEFPPEAKAKALALIADVRAALAERIRDLDWMGEETKARAFEKLSAMSVKVGYPDRWKDFTDADVGDRPFVENWLRAAAYEHRRAIARLGQHVDRGQWWMSPHAVNAYASSSNNEIVFPAGILQPPFFHASADDAANYGGIGMVIGHEITHLFDDRGRRFDARGNLRDWWTRDDERRYVERAKRVERQYGAYVGVEDTKLDGRLTLGENISDIGGLKIAYVAYQKALARNPSAHIGGLTPEQRYFVAFAQSWRARYRPEQERLLIQTDSHSPPRFRVAGPIANMPEFARAFSCDPAKSLLPESGRVDLW